MPTTVNPWLTRDPTPVGTSEQEAPRLPTPTGPTQPQAGVPAPAPALHLPVATEPDEASLWVLGVHGGSAESTLASLHPSWREAGHAWPAPTANEPAVVLLAARTSVHGLLAAQAAATSWAANMVPHVELLGLVLVADTPGRLPRPVRELAHVVGGGVPRTWHIPWVKAWRLGEEPALNRSPRAVRRFVTDINALHGSATTSTGQDQA